MCFLIYRPPHVSSHRPDSPLNGAPCPGQQIQYAIALPGEELDLFVSHYGTLATKTTLIAIGGLVKVS
jgi:hypothetical protein